ncbi:MAG: VCBS repeat-containing protein, partial [Terriglobales bacterium]
MPPNGFAFRPSLLAGQIPTAVATGDFNGDGKLDWAVSNGQDNSVWLYLGNGDGTASLPTILPTTGIAPAWMIATDLNGDGKLDLVVAEADSSTIGVFLGNGDGTFQTEARYSVPAAPLFLLAGDFTGDGKVDIAAGMIGATTTGPIAVLPGDGQGHLGTAVFTGDPNASVGYWLAAADLNGDGKLDLIVVDPDDGPPHGGAQAYLNNGNGTFTAGQVLFVNDFLPPPTPSDLALSVAIADVNNDGCQ